MDSAKVQITTQTAALGSSMTPLASPPDVPSVRKRGGGLVIFKILHQLASLRLTVALFALSDRKSVV